MFEDKPTSEEELMYWLAFNLVPNFGAARIGILEERLQSMKTAWNASDVVLKRLHGIGDESIAELNKARKTIDPEKLLMELKDAGLKAWTWNDPLYPLRLRQIHKPPVVLYVNGDIERESFNSVVGIVGTRRPTAYGQRIAKEFARDLSQNGITVISGMALGCDAHAHWGAIEGGSPTVAVLGCGADQCYPSSNRKLFEAITKEGKGIVISEYPPGTQPDTFRFPERNRIIAGICSALIVVEGAEDSGSLITAQLAFEGDTEVYAVPGRIDNPMAMGPHKLIREHKAAICTGIEDLLRGKDWERTRAGAGRERAAVVQLWGREKEIYDFISHEAIHFDQLCDLSGMTSGELSATLTMLELAGLILREPGDWYSRYSDLKVRT